jgi:hypothetical protein
VVGALDIGCGCCCDEELACADAVSFSARKISIVP